MAKKLEMYVDRDNQRYKTRSEDYANEPWILEVWNWRD
jgi:hypothetical protein